MPRYERDNDQIERVLKDTHETVGRLRTLIEDLSSHINDLENEINPPRFRGKGV